MNWNILPGFYWERFESQYGTTERVLLAGILGVAVWVRFWGLGNIGLFGDEETMAMPAMSILETGLPYLPGMLYPRGLLELYMMAGSIWIFGESEWALRFPSAVMGVLTVVIAFYLGKRFLPPRWNLLFVLIIALLPQMIAVSQTARMYVFFAGFLMLFAIAVFRWGERPTWGRLALAFLVWLIALQFQELSVFYVFLFFLPGIVQQSFALLTKAALAFVLSVGSYFVSNHLVGLAYGDVTKWTGPGADAISPLFYLLVEQRPLMTLCAALLILPLLLLTVRSSLRDWNSRIGLILLGLGGLACLLLHYHLGAIFLGFAALWYLHAGNRAVWLVLYFGAVGVVFIIEAFLLQQSGLAGGAKEILRTMVGTPSVWTYLRFGEHFLPGMALYALPLAYGVYRLLREWRLPVHYLLFVLAVWLPMIGIGLFRWDFPPRYMFGSVPFFVLCTLAGFHFMVADLSKRASPRLIATATVSLVVLSLALINPLELYYNVNPKYADFRHLTGQRGADHKGAAEFMEARPISPNDIVLAEDVLQQVYYLGKDEVDYWLRARSVASGRIKDGVFRDTWTDTPLVGTGDDLAHILSDANRGDVYVIGSGEAALNRSRYLGDGILEVIQQGDPEVVFTGRDRLTVVWYFPADHRAST